MNREIDFIWYVRAIAFMIFIVLIKNFSVIAIVSTIFIVFFVSFFLSKILELGHNTNSFKYAIENAFYTFLAITLILIATLFFKTLSVVVLFFSALFCISVLVLQDFISLSVDYFLNEFTNACFYNEKFGNPVRFLPLVVSLVVFFVCFDWKTLKLIENSSWNSIDFKDLMNILEQFSGYNEKFVLSESVSFVKNSAKEVTMRILSEQLEAIYSIRKSLKIAWWLAFAFGLIAPFLKFFVGKK